jgi:molecular chaperone GrpE
MSVSERDERPEGAAAEEQPSVEMNLAHTLRLKELEESLAAKTQEAEATYQRLLRLGAEFENYKKRTEREQKELFTFAQAQLITTLLPILDNLERAIEATRHPSLSSQQTGLLSGVEMVWKQFREVLFKAGVAEIVTAGECFDPIQHEAVEVQQTAEHPDGTILDEYQKGYRLHGKVLRPAKVVVAKSPAAVVD